jgi:hypothetical protein
MSPEAPKDYAEQVIVEAVPKSTLVVAGALYAIVVALVAWNLSTAVTTGRDIAEMKGSFKSDIDSLKQRADRADARQDVFDDRLRNLEPARRR